MEKQFLNPTTFNSCLVKQVSSTGYLHTDAYLFSVTQTTHKNNQVVIYDVIYRCGTHECHPFETVYWQHSGCSDIKIVLDLKQQIGAMYFDEDTPSGPFLPILFWKDVNGRQCIGTHLLNEHPIVLEFNGEWITMFHNDESDRLGFKEYIKIFIDQNDRGMQESIQAARNSLTVIAAQSTGDWNSIFYYNV